MKNTEVIKALQCCANGGCFEGCPRLALVEDALECRERLMMDAADALKAANKQIDELEADKKTLINVIKDKSDFHATKDAMRIAELEVQMPKEGEWIMLDSKNIVEMCSRCRYTDYTARHSHYCPNCGARMTFNGKQKTESKNTKSSLEYDYCGIPKRRYDIEARDRRANNE